MGLITNLDIPVKNSANRLTDCLKKAINNLNIALQISFLIKGISNIKSIHALLLKRK